MSGVNKAILIGRLGKDPETKDVGDSTVCKFSLATSRKYKKNDGTEVEETEWHRIVCWGGLAKVCGRFLEKGRECYVEGRLHYDKYEKDGVTKYTTDIVADTVQFLGGKGSVGREPGDDAGEPAPSGGSDF